MKSTSDTDAPLDKSTKPAMERRCTANDEHTSCTYRMDRVCIAHKTDVEIGLNHSIGDRTGRPGRKSRRKTDDDIGRNHSIGDRTDRPGRKSRHKTDDGIGLFLANRSINRTECKQELRNARSLLPNRKKKITGIQKKKRDKKNKKKRESFIEITTKPTKMKKPKKTGNHS
jgi:hypothetical protein